MVVERGENMSENIGEIELTHEVIIETRHGRWALRPPMTQAERAEVRARGLAPISTSDVERLEGAGERMPETSVEALRLVLTTLGGRVESARALR